jgi:hypothetical protein
MATSARILRPFTHVAAVTVDRDTPAGGPAAFATTPAMAAPKVVPSGLPQAEAAMASLYSPSS